MPAIPVRRAFHLRRDGQSADMRPFDDISRLESMQSLDRVAAPVRSAAQKVLRDRRVKDALHGVWLGHPLHPGLAQFAAGAFLSASLIDAVRGNRRTSSGLIGVGLAATLPTVASGWADWSESFPDQQRVGLVHAAVNGTAAALYGRALIARLRGRGGRLSSLAGGALVSVGALLGGHIGYRQALGANHAEDVAHTAPADWQPLAPLAEIPEGGPTRHVAGTVPVVVIRRGEQLTVLADRCPHLSAPLSDGELVGTDGDTRLVCPWHGSEFRLDGCVVHGPATASVPRFETRVADGTVQARVVTIPGVPAG